MAKYEILIPRDPQKRLKALTVGRGSVLQADLFGVPEDLDMVQVHVGRSGSPGIFTCVPCIARSNRRWYCYASGLNFAEAGEVEYHVTGTDPRGGSHWLGRGKLTIEPSVLTCPEAPIVPEDTYVRNPETGLWHKLTVTFDDGVLTPEVSTEGITR